MSKKNVFCLWTKTVFHPPLSGTFVANSETRCPAACKTARKDDRHRRRGERPASRLRCHSSPRLRDLLPGTEQGGFTAGTNISMKTALGLSRRPSWDVGLGFLFALKSFFGTSFRSFYCHRRILWDGVCSCAGQPLGGGYGVFAYPFKVRFRVKAKKRAAVFFAENSCPVGFYSIVRWGIYGKLSVSQLRHFRNLS